MKHWYVFTLILKFLNRLVIKDKKRVVFLPHQNGKADDYDIINYRSDNVLYLLNYIISVNDYNDLNLIVFYYDETKIDKYIAYVKNINPTISVSFIYYSEFNVIKALLKSNICFTDQAYYNFRFKVFEQRFICLGYFTPFKRDYLWDGYNNKYVTHREFKKEFKKHNASFDVYITSSDTASRVLSIDTGIDFYKFDPLGMPRNMVFNLPCTKCEDILKKMLKVSFDKIVIYTPTFRDYDEKEGLNLFGYEEGLDKVEDVLNSHNAVLIAKLHPKKKYVKDVKEQVSRIINYNDLPSLYSLYDYLSVSDVLITDYTSTYFDFLYADKPVIFNNYDIKEYSAIRGFSYNPITPFCAGYKVNTYSEFCEALNDSLSKDEFSEQRKVIHGIMNTASNKDICFNICKKYLK